MVNTATQASSSPPKGRSDPLAITGLILAGGAGQRMGGRDKGLELLAGTALVTRVYERIAPQVSGLLISANRHLTTYAALGWPVVADAPEHAAQGYCGPLAGLLAGLRAAPHELVLCVPCDTPFLPLDLAQRLLDTLGDAPLAVARCGGETQPTICLVRRALMSGLAHYLATGERAMGRWQREQGAVYADFSDTQAFANLNTLSDLLDSA
jgi:molybdenum cofactor guanylyltransferase